MNKKDLVIGWIFTVLALILIFYLAILAYEYAGFWAGALVQVGLTFSLALLGKRLQNHIPAQEISRESMFGIRKQ